MAFCFCPKCCMPHCTCYDLTKYKLPKATIPQVTPNHVYASSALSTYLKEKRIDVDKLINDTIKDDSSLIFPKKPWEY